MSKSRRRSREKKKAEEALERKNEYGKNDPTPRLAVANIIAKEKQKQR
ncbi:hypothetical protein [Acetobacterium tundrae]|uniref:Uncharacterized protein n=1 Tax=Acetobacterium tundrae TaxID=132932 RepID=A0ABR6WLC0_9FIRM|nr:hypothetical protein [Acetobacterium tundrae]MBC3797164.1 hypothetical protein [Acetobacterium tundrae]